MAWSGSSPNRIRGRKWMKIRERILARDPICRRCEAKGKTALSTIVDHDTPLSEGGANDDSNLFGICGPCHDEKTQQEAAKAQGRSAPTMKPKATIGLDGWPI